MCVFCNIRTKIKEGGYAFNLIIFIIKFHVKFRVNHEENLRVVVAIVVAIIFGNNSMVLNMPLQFRSG